MATTFTQNPGTVYALSVLNNDAANASLLSGTLLDGHLVTANGTTVVTHALTTNGGSPKVKP